MIVRDSTSGQKRDVTRPTIYDVARSADVSPATVSKVLRGVTTVGADNASRVMLAVRDLGFRSDPLAANLRRNRRSIIGLIVPDFKNPFFGSLVAAIEQLAEGSGYRLVAVSSSEAETIEHQQIEALLDWRVAGIILIPSSANQTDQTLLRSEGTPFIVVDRVSKTSPFDGVGVDNAEACAKMVRHFYDHGHRKLTIAASLPGLHNMKERIEGACAAASSMSEPMETEVLYCGPDLSHATAAVAKRFEQGTPPRAVFALFIQATLAVLREVDKLGLNVPGDISLAGFDDFEWMQVMHPPVATVIQPIAEMAAAAWKQLLQRIDFPDDPPTAFQIPCSLEFRGSIARPREEGIQNQIRSAMLRIRRSPRLSGS
jgi:LacI family transcriptional regulator